MSKYENLTFNLEKTPEAYEEIMLAISELKKACVKNRIPLFLSIATANTKTDTSYYNQMINPSVYGYSINDDNFKDYVNIMNGFKTYFASDDNDDSDYLELVKELEANNLMDLNDYADYEDDIDLDINDYTSDDENGQNDYSEDEDESEIQE